MLTVLTLALSCSSATPNADAFSVEGCGSFKYQGTTYYVSCLQPSGPTNLVKDDFTQFTLECSNSCIQTVSITDRTFPASITIENISTGVSATSGFRLTLVSAPESYPTQTISPNDFVEINWGQELDRVTPNFFGTCGFVTATTKLEDTNGNGSLDPGESVTCLGDQIDGSQMDLVQLGVHHNSDGSETLEAQAIWSAN